MKRWAEVLIVLFAVAFFTAPSFAQERPGQQRATAYASAPNIDYDSAPNFLKLPTGTYLGEAMGVARDSKGNCGKAKKRHSPEQRPAGVLQGRPMCQDQRAQQ